MIRLHHVPQSRSMRSLWLLHEVGVAFDVVEYPFDGTLRAEPYRSLNPTGRVPTLEIDGEVIWESGAIAQVLCERFAPDTLGRPAGHPERAAWLNWIHYAETVSAHAANLTQQHIMLREDWMRSPTLMKLEAARMRRTLLTVDAALAGQDYLLSGGFSAADVGVGHATYIAQFYVKLDEMAQLSRWFDRLKERQAFRKALPDRPVLYREDFYAPWDTVPPPPEA